MSNHAINQSIYQSVIKQSMFEIIAKGSSEMHDNMHLSIQGLRSREVPTDISC